MDINTKNLCKSAAQKVCLEFEEEIQEIALFLMIEEKLDPCLTARIASSMITKLLVDDRIIIKRKM